MAYPQISELNCCPYCGNKEFFIKQRYKGECEVNLRFDKSDDVDNTNIYASVEHKTISKFAYCNNCFKKIAKLDDDYYI